MKKVSIKVLKPFSYRGKMRKVGHTLGVNEKFANAMILLQKAELFAKEEQKKPPAPRRRTRTTAVKSQELNKQVIEQEKEPEEKTEDKAETE